ncbi:hypothetical protein [Novosphingobium sp. KACC 22771]|uniref:hypothetical protein n=1 Tax=Novosphingobium sp. KACC 22771 TaxID=3025670 RepID=UPI002365D3AF|nr:hypothetical protein [Novosphingobium sp. KACC 22771]WDF71223.1 hypothetical protein PQ467_10335 [Novosphingobium sp. KACC 22771]
MTVPSPSTSAFHVLFPPGLAPKAQAVFDLLRQDAEVARIFSVTHQPEADSDWLELLSSGLTFDLSGLAGGGSAPDIAMRYDISAVTDLDHSAWLRLAPGAHLSGGGRQLPVVRAMAGVVLGLLKLPGAAGVAWGPARTVMSAEHFCRIVPAWLNGGAFPALGLTALRRDEEGNIVSEGLSFFTGLELRIEPILADQPGLAGKIAIRLIHSLVDGWTVKEPVEVEGPGGEILGLTPEENGKILRICLAR